MLNINKYYTSILALILVLFVFSSDYMVSNRYLCDPVISSNLNVVFPEQKKYVPQILSEHPPITITSEQNFTDYGFPGNGTETNPYRIENFNIFTTEKSAIAIYNLSVFFVISNCLVSADRYGIYIENVSFYDLYSQSYLPLVSIFNNDCYNCWQGINIFDAWNCTVQHNICFSNENYGIKVEQSWYSMVTNNTCYNNFRGIVLFESTRSVIMDNYCFNNLVGLTLWSSLDAIGFNNTCVFNNYSGISIYSGYVTLRNNNCSNNLESGIELDGGSSSKIWNNLCQYNKYGIFSIDSFYTNITENICLNNDYGIFLTFGSWYDVLFRNNCTNNYIHGIHADRAKECIFSFNYISLNTFYGFYFTNNTKGSIIAYNIVKDNNLGGISQAYDDGEENIWYDEQNQKGNYWSDWSGEGVYKIDGKANSSDFYPLTEKLERPTPTFLTSTNEFHWIIAIFSLTLLIASSIYRKKRIKTKVLSKT